jgi:glutamine synthetase
VRRWYKSRWRPRTREGGLGYLATMDGTVTAGGASSAAPLTLDALRDAVRAGAVDTVVLALTDMQGRLQGKRLTARHFLDEVVAHGAEACNYLLAVDVDMNTVSGYAISSWERGYGDFEMVPDLATLRMVPWQPGTAMCLADLRWADGADVAPSPRQVLAGQLARLAERGLAAYAGTELEFIVFRDSYEAAWRKGYRDLEPANLYNVDYSVLGTSRVEPLIRRIREAMTGAGMSVENSKGECNLGQHEINFRYGEAMRAADEHAIYKTGAKEIAAQEGMAITFMAKWDEREGNSCHIHLSLRRDDGSPLFAEDPAAFQRFLAGQLACLRELTLLYAPNVNSYKRFASESFAPTAVAWGEDNRTCAVRVVGHGAGRRMELRLPGADVNPYLALSALIAAGLHGMDAGLELEAPVEGNAYASEKPRVPGTLRDAHDRFAASAVAREAFGQEVVDHYLNAARVELAAFEAAVTDWERVRGFERL